MTLLIGHHQLRIQAVGLPALFLEWWCGFVEVTSGPQALESRC